MNKEYLIKIVEDYCNENNLDITEVYEKMADMYLNTYGVNILMEATEHSYYDVVYYLEARGIIDRYITILNRIKKEQKINT